MDHRNMNISRLPGPALNLIVENSDEAQPSLSDLHDFEPKLEFDDTELLATPITPQHDVMDEDFVVTEDCNDEVEDAVNPLEDDFEDQLREETENFSISPKRTNCDFLGTDKQGRHIFAIYATRFPEKT